MTSNRANLPLEICSLHNISHYKLQDDLIYLDPGQRDCWRRRLCHHGPRQSPLDQVGQEGNFWPLVNGAVVNAGLACELLVVEDKVGPEGVDQDNDELADPAAVPKRAIKIPLNI